VSSRGWAADGIVRGLRSTIRRPSDAVLAARIGLFIARMPRRLARRPLDQLLNEVDLERRSANGRTESAGVDRISILRQAWLASPLFRNRNTCYLRAFVLYRFLDVGSGKLAIHFGVEPGMNESDRLHGHAWVSLAGDVLEAPEPVLAGRVTELFSHYANA
jgi:hypothetical protein